mgnify:FL=1
MRRLLLSIFLVPLCSVIGVQEAKAVEINCASAAWRNSAHCEGKEKRKPRIITTCDPSEEGLCGAESDTSVNQASFDLWCGQVKNDCTVSFEGDRMRVNNNKGIKRDQLLLTWEDQEMREFWRRNSMVDGWYDWVFYVTYKKSDGTESTGKFIAGNIKTASKFRNALAAFFGSKRREVGPNIQLEMKKDK